MEKRIIVEHLANIQMELKVPKTRYNKFGEYNYRSCEDILDAVKKLAVPLNCAVTCTDELVMIGERYYVKATAQITCGEQLLFTRGYSREPEKPKAKTDESQQTGSTSSYARKYALNGLFAIDDTVDSDTTNTQEEEPRAGSDPRPKEEKTPETVEAERKAAGENYMRRQMLNLSKELFKTLDEFKAWRVDSGLVESLINLTPENVVAIHEKLLVIKAIRSEDNVEEGAPNE